MTHSTDESDRPGGDTTRASLLIRLRDPADREAWRLFVETYTPMIYGYCRRRGLQASDVADVTQDVMTEVMRSIREFSYQPERGRFRDWLGMIARRKLIRFFDREGRAGKGDGDAADELIRQVAAPESDTMWTEAFQARILEVALGHTRPCFEDATWRAFERTWLDGREPAEVARELGVPVDSIYVSRSRVLKRLREEVMVLAEDFPIAAASRH